MVKNYDEAFIRQHAGIIAAYGAIRPPPPPVITKENPVEYEKFRLTFGPEPDLERPLVSALTLFDLQLLNAESGKICGRAAMKSVRG